MTDDIKPSPIYFMSEFIIIMLCDTEIKALFNKCRMWRTKLLITEYFLPHKLSSVSKLLSGNVFDVLRKL